MGFRRREIFFGISDGTSAELTKVDENIPALALRNKGGSKYAPFPMPSAFSGDGKRQASDWVGYDKGYGIQQRFP